MISTMVQTSSFFPHFELNSFISVECVLLQKLENTSTRKNRLIMTLKLGKNWSEEQTNKRLVQLQQKKKAILLKQLQNELRHLDDLDDQDFVDDQDPAVNDVTLKRLQMIYKQAKKLEILEIQKLCRLAIGKRILNIELKRKKDEHNAKLRKKEKIELFFRENRVKRYDYNTLIEEKLNHSTFIVKAYDNGKGFVESDRIYKEKYSNALTQCNFMKNIKEVNKIFYANYSGANKNSIPLSQTLFKLLWIPLIVFLVMGVTLPFISFENEEIVLMVILGVILVILFYVSIGSFINKPNQNNQIQQSISDVKAYFQGINQVSELKGTNIQWTVSKDFMYLQVIFHDGFPL